MICVTVSGGQIVADGVPPCADLAVLTAAEAAQVLAQEASPFALTVEDATALAWMIIPLWVVAFIFRQLSKPATWR